MKLKIETKGNTNFITEFEDKVMNLLEEEIYDATEATATYARIKAPVGEGILKSSIYTEHKNLEGVITVGARYAAFIEFGTGALVDPPPEWEDYAAEFKGQKFGTWEEFEQSILLWMRRKGIEEDALFPIMMKLYKVGVTPQPFLYPAWKQATDEMMENLKRQIGTK